MNPFLYCGLRTLFRFIVSTFWILDFVIVVLSFDDIGFGVEDLRFGVVDLNLDVDLAVLQFGALDRICCGPHSCPCGPQILCCGLLIWCCGTEIACCGLQIIVQRFT